MTSEPISRIDTSVDVAKYIGTSEHIRLEFKSSQIFYDFKTNTPKRGEYVDVLSKGISGFANTEGGRIIIGLETDRVEKEADKAIRLDQGIAFKDFSPDTIQRSVEASISPPLQGLRFIPVKSSRDKKRYYLVSMSQRGIQPIRQKIKSTMEDRSLKPLHCMIL